MSIVVYSEKEISFKIVFWGCGLSGKSTFIDYINANTSSRSKGKLISLSTKLDRTIFFDFLPLYIEEIYGYKVRFHLYAVPGQVFYSKVRKTILNNFDAIIFIADSQVERLDANRESFAELKKYLDESKVDIKKIPLLLCYNKRDLPNTASLEEMEMMHNEENDLCSIETVVCQGYGVVQGFKLITNKLIEKAKKEIEGIRIADNYEINEIKDTMKTDKHYFKLEFTTDQIITGHWNPVCFNVTYDGNILEKYVNIRFLEDDNSDIELKSMEPNNSFTIAINEYNSNATIWVKSKKDGLNNLHYKLMDVDKDYPFMANSFNYQEAEKYSNKRLKTILFLDITDSTRIWKDQQWSELLMENLKGLILSLIGKETKINKSIGDSYLITFESPSYAILTAYSILKYIQETKNIYKNYGFDIKFGIDVGEISNVDLDLQKEDELFGINVCIASRLCSSANKGEIIISKNVFSIVKGELVRNHFDFKEIDLYFENIGDIKAYKLSSIANSENKLTFRINPYKG